MVISVLGLCYVDYFLFLDEILFMVLRRIHTLFFNVYFRLRLFNNTGLHKTNAVRYVVRQY